MIDFLKAIGACGGLVLGLIAWGFAARWLTFKIIDRWGR